MLKRLRHPVHSLSEWSVQHPTNAENAWGYLLAGGLALVAERGGYWLAFVFGGGQMLQTILTLTLAVGLMAVAQVIRHAIDTSCHVTASLTTRWHDLPRTNRDRIKFLKQRLHK